MTIIEKDDNHLHQIAIGVIGGGFGSYHIRGILGEPDIYELRTVCDSNPDVLERIQNDLPPNCTMCTDYKQVFEDPSIDAVVISLPHHLHEQVCVEAANYKKHILVDKPIARTLEEADVIIQAAEENQITLMVAQTFRFSSIYQKMHALLEKGVIGKPLYAMTRHIQNFNPPKDAYWRSKESVGGGCLMGSGIHNMDMMRWLFGEPEEVFAYATGDHRRLEAEVAASVSYKYKNGAVVNFACNWSSHGAMNDFEWNEWAVFGTEGDIAIKNGDLIVGREYGSKIDKITPDYHEYENIWTHFARCLVNGDEPLVNGKEGKKSLTLVLKAYESIETGKPISC